MLIFVFSIPFLPNKDGKMAYSLCTVYSRNYSIGDMSGGMLFPDVSQADVPVVPCPSGWKFQHADQEATSIVADVSTFKRTE